MHLVKLIKLRGFKFLTIDNSTTKLKILLIKVNQMAKIGIKHLITAHVPQILTLLHI